MIHEAIYNLYPEVKSIQEDRQGNLTILDEDKNIVEVDMSAVQIKAEELQISFDNEINAKQEKKESGRQKLKDLGLDDDEIDALTN